MDPIKRTEITETPRMVVPGPLGSQNTVAGGDRNFDTLPNRNRSFGISLNTHNVMDYVGGVVLMASPYVFGFSDIESARNVFLVLGAGLIIYSLLTNYRYSIAKIIPLGVHMALDVIAGIFLMLAPSIWAYRPLLTGGEYAWHFIIGLGVIALVAVTRRVTEAQMPMSDADETGDEVKAHKAGLTRIEPEETDRIRRVA
jgi:hypothetical protein